MLHEKLIERVGRMPVCGTALRWCANQYRENSVVTIRHGYAAGRLWKRQRRYVNGYWIGHYEWPIQEALARELKPGDSFYDVGANAGFFTLIGALRVGPAGKCIAFDPSPDNCQSIRELLELNGLAHCTVVQKALADVQGQSLFSFAAPGCATGRLGQCSEKEHLMMVQTMTLDLASEQFGPPALIKMDIEGAESKALVGASHVLKKIRPILLIELHGAQCEQEVTQLLSEADYDLFEISGAPARLTAVPQHLIARPKY